MAFPVGVGVGTTLTAICPLPCLTLNSYILILIYDIPFLFKSLDQPDIRRQSAVEVGCTANERLVVSAVVSSCLVVNIDARQRACRFVPTAFAVGIVGRALACVASRRLYDATPVAKPIGVG